MKLGLLVSESFRHWVMRAVRLLDSSKNCLICCQQVCPKHQKCPASRTRHLLPTEATAPPGLSPSQGHCLPHTDTFSLTIFAPPLPLKDFAFWLKGHTKPSPLSISRHLTLTLQCCLDSVSPSLSPEHRSYYPSYL